MGGDPFYIVQARRHDRNGSTAAALVAVHAFREFTDVGGLVSYGTNIANTYRQVGINVGQNSSKGANPADLPSASADHVRIGDQPQNR